MKPAIHSLTGHGGYSISTVLVLALILLAVLAAILQPRDRQAWRFSALLVFSALAVGASDEAFKGTFWGPVVVVCALAMLPTMFLAYCSGVASSHGAASVVHGPCSRFVQRTVGLSGIGAAMFWLVALSIERSSVRIAVWVLLCTQVFGFATGMVFLWHAYRGNSSSRSVVLLTSVGAVVAFGPLVTTDELPSLIGLAPLVPVTIASWMLLAFPLAVGLASLQWRPFGVVALVDRVSVYSLIIVALLLVYAGMGLTLDQVFGIRVPVLSQLLAFGLATVAAVTFEPLRARLQQGVDMVLYRDYYELEATLQQVSQNLTERSDRQGVLEFLLATLSDTLNLSGIAAIVLPDGLHPSLVQVLQSEDVLAHGELASYAGRRGILQALATLDEATLSFSAERPLVLNPWEGCAALLMIGGGQGANSGVLLILGAKRSRSPLGKKDCALLVTVAHQAAIALANGVLLEGLRISLGQLQTSSAQLAEARREQQLLLRELLNAEENQRAALTRELHDDALQDVLFILRHATVCERLLDGIGVSSTSGSTAGGAVTSGVQPAAFPAEDGRATAAYRLRQELRQMAESSAAVEHKLRDLCLGLYPEMLHSLGLLVALEELARDPDAFSDVQVTVDYSPQTVTAADGLRQDEALHLYRIAQEAVRNAVQHGGATSVSVRVDVLADASQLARQQLRLCVVDNGTGIPAPVDYAALLQAGHLGLASMRQRAEALEAVLRVGPAPSGGTAVCVLLPVAVPGDEDLAAVWSRRTDVEACD